MKYTQIRSNYSLSKYDLQKGQEVVGKSISTIKDNVNKDMQSWAEMSKDAKVKPSMLKSKLKQIALWIEVVKKQKRNTSR